MKVVVFVHMSNALQNLFGNSLAILVGALFKEEFKFDVEVHDCSYFEGDVVVLLVIVLLLVVVEHLDAVHDVVVLEHLQTSYLSQTTKVNPLRLIIRLLIDLYGHVLRTHLPVLLKDLEGRLKGSHPVVITQLVQVN